MKLNNLRWTNTEGADYGDGELCRLVGYAIIVMIGAMTMGTDDGIAAEPGLPGRSIAVLMTRQSYSRSSISKSRIRLTLPLWQHLR